MNYFLGFGKDRYTGTFDREFVSTKMITDEFIGFDYQKKFYFFFPPTLDNAYEFGEVPVNLRGTDAILLSKNNIASKVQKLTFQQGEKGLNFSKTNIFLNLQLGEGKVSRTDRKTLSGAVSTDRRFYYTETDEGESLKTQINKLSGSNNDYVLDSAKIVKSEKTPPFLFTIQENFHSGRLISSPDKGVYTISLSNLIQHHLLDYTTGKRSTTYIPSYLYDDNTKLYLVFDKKIELLNGDQFKSAWSGSPGSYQLTVTQVNETTLLIDSDYQVGAITIAPENYHLIGELNTEALKVASLQVIVRVKQ
jgi:hypothetical protein